MADRVKIFTVPEGAFSRRRLLAGTGAAAVAAAALAACGSSGGGAEEGSEAATTAPAAEPTPAVTEAEAAPVTEAEAAPAVTEAEAAPEGGGKILRLGVLGGANDLLDGQHIVGKSDIARHATGWEPLMSFNEKFVPEYTNGIAQDVTAKTPDNFVIKLKDGVKFSNGNDVTAEDVIYSLTRALDDELKLSAGGALRGLLTPEGITKVDDQTVDVKMLQAVSNFTDILCAYTLCIVPVDYERFTDDPTNQVGTGPYMLKEFEVGKASVHVKNPHYWGGADKLYFDEVHIIDFADADSMINALLADQIDLANDLPATAVETVEGEGMSVLNSPGGGWLTIDMAVDQAPFTDVRVRQAMRLIVDRDAMVEQVAAGYGRVANDLFAPLDAAYLGDTLPQRKQDIEAAKKLLADAGQSDLVIDLFAPNDTAGLPEMVTLFAEQAKEAGITVNPVILDGGAYWGDEYLKRTFCTDFWGTRSFLLQCSVGSLKDTSPWPGDHWPPEGSTFADDYKAALAEVDDGKRKVITDKMQTELYEEGGLIIPFFGNLLDGYNPRVQGLQVRPNTLNLDHFGRGFKNLSFSE